MGALAQRDDRVWLLAAALLSAVGGALIPSVVDNVRLGEQFALYPLLLGLLVASVVAYRVIGRSEPSLAFDVRWFYAAPIVVTSVLLSVISGSQAHQLAWALLAGIFGLLTLANSAHLRVAVPLWLVAYAVGGLVLRLFSTLDTSLIFDVGLSVVALFVMWQVARSLAAPGGVMRFLGAVAACYWAVTVLGVLVELTGVSIGAMNPSTVVLPWQEGAFADIFVNGNYQGYGFITAQGGREISFIVGLYHFLGWRRTRAVLPAVLAGIAAHQFLTSYGRVPLVGAVVGFTVVLLTTRRGTSFSRLLVGTFVLIAIIFATGAASRIVDVSSREGGTSTGFDTGHASLWSQHLGLFIQHPLAGVGSNPSAREIAETWENPVISAYQPLMMDDLLARGSRGEGGWTGLIAQRGIFGGAIVLALLGLAVAYCLRPFPRDPLAAQDMTVLRGVLPASFIFTITDIAPFSPYSVTAYVLGQLTLIAVVRELARRSPRFTSEAS
ncbi:MAG: hypothetical protein WKF33_00735 [Thermoleophilaceae bacterium]